MSSPDHLCEPDRLAWLAEIYRTYAADLQRAILHKVGDPFLAEDLTSMVFLKALRWLSTVQSMESVRGWLYATARTTIADHWQMLAQYEVQPLTGIEDQFLWQPEGGDAIQQQASFRVRRLLNRLPERERKVLELRYLQGYSAAEIAGALGTNAGHIRVLQLRALRRAAQFERQERNSSIMQEQEASFEAYIPFLTAESLRAFDQAYEEAQNLQHTFIGTEHLLWGLASEGSLSSFLAPLGITPERVHRGIVFIYDRQPQWSQLGGSQGTSSAAVPAVFRILTPRTKQVLILAGDEMKSQGEQQIRPAHLLLGLMNEGSGIGAGLLHSLGVILVQARAALVPSVTMQTCSFCGRSGSQVKRIFPSEAMPSSPPPSAFICDRCVERFHTMLGEGGA